MQFESATNSVSVILWAKWSCWVGHQVSGNPKNWNWSSVTNFHECRSWPRVSHNPIALPNLPLIWIEALFCLNDVNIIIHVSHCSIGYSPVYAYIFSGNLLQCSRPVSQYQLAENSAFHLPVVFRNQSLNFYCVQAVQTLCNIFLLNNIPIFVQWQMTCAVSYYHRWYLLWIQESIIVMRTSYLKMFSINFHQYIQCLLSVWKSYRHLRKQLEKWIIPLLWKTLFVLSFVIWSNASWTLSVQKPSTEDWHASLEYSSFGKRGTLYGLT